MMNQIDIFGTGAPTKFRSNSSLFEYLHIALNKNIRVLERKPATPSRGLLDQDDFRSLDLIPRWRVCEESNHAINDFGEFIFQVKGNMEITCRQQVQSRLIALNSILEDLVKVFNLLGQFCDFLPFSQRKSMGFFVYLTHLRTRRFSVHIAQLLQGCCNWIEERVHQCRAVSSLLRYLPTRYPICSGNCGYGTKRASPSCRDWIRNGPTKYRRCKRERNKSPDGPTADKCPLAL